MKINLNLIKKILYFSGFSLLVVFILTLFLYLYLLPNLISSNRLISYVSHFVKKEFNLELVIENPNLKTSVKPEIVFNVDNFILKNNVDTLIKLENFNLNFEFGKIFNKEISIKELSAKKLEVNADEIVKIIPKENNNKNSKPFDFKINVLDSKIKLDKFMLSYLQNGNALLVLNVADLNLRNSLNAKNLCMKFNATIYKNNRKMVQADFIANDEIKILNDKILVDNLNVVINKSKLNVFSKANLNEFVFSIKSSKFHLIDVFDLVDSDFVIPNGSLLLLPLNSPKGDIGFDVTIKNNQINGLLDVNNTAVNIKDINNIPICIVDGKIKITNEKIDFQKMYGYYGNNLKNKIQIQGDIKDYYKTFDSNIVIESVITNDFFKNYLAKLINNTVLYVSKPSRTKIIYKSKNNIMDIIWFAQIDKGVDFGITKEKSALSNYDRAFLGEFNIANNKIDVKNINYYIASNIVRGVKLQPIINANALLDFEGKIDKAGFSFGREMPSEFLNIFAGQNVFKKGTIKGNLNVVFKNDIPILDANMELNKVLVPSQRIAIKHAKVFTQNNLINLIANGRFKRAKFDFSGKIKNELKTPIVIKSLKLDVDNVDLEKMLISLNTQNENQQQNIEIENEDEIADDNYMFDTNLVRIENCEFNLEKGNYKELTFGNIKANLTLDENGILNIYSNKFDIAQGISSLKINADLKDLKYYIKLGVKGVNSSLMAKVLFNLEREISGFANGLIELSGDSSLKMNGDVKFSINEGTIGKIGLVEYLMKIASVFRNPIVMISPATIMDIISIPEGRFDKIQGELKIKDNVVQNIFIKSYSKSLSALIRGRFDMERHDASLRIYTRFSSDKKNAFNILRSLSLNSLANKVKLNSGLDANYYASELKDLPDIEVENDKTQIFLTQVEGDIEHFNFLSSLKKIK